MLEGLHPNNPTYVARVTANEAAAKRIANLLGESFDPAQTAVAAFEMPDGSSLPPWLVEAFFASEPNRSAVRELIGVAAGEAVTVTFDQFDERDWIAASLEGLAPVPAGRFVVHGAHDRAFIAQNAIGIEIEAALAFGTGHHGTTRGCLLALDDLLKRERPKRILDIGTGTGVLAIAAARALRRSIIASDIDPVAIATARNNAKFNHARSYIKFFQANGAGARPIKINGPYDLVFANIILRPLVRLALPMARLMTVGATVILSGLLHSQANAALSAYRSQGLHLIRRYRLDEWTTLVLKRGKLKSSTQWDRIDHEHR